jgi:hypothetical protein
MRSLTLLALELVAFSHLVSISAFLTHESMRNLTSLTEDCRERITAEEESEAVVQVLGGGQVVLQSEHGDRDEVEDVSCSVSFLGNWRRRTDETIDHRGSTENFMF